MDELEKIQNQISEASKEIGETRDKISEALAELTHKGIESFCRGESLEVIKAKLSGRASVFVRSKMY